MHDELDWQLMIYILHELNVEGFTRWQSDTEMTYKHHIHQIIYVRK
jgi:hypothetical protein